MVGTNPMRFPPDRDDARARRSSETVVMVCIALLDFRWIGGRPTCDCIAEPLRQSIRLFRSGEYTVADVRPPTRERLLQQLKAIDIGTNEFGTMSLGQAQNVMQHEYLARTARTCTDSNRRYCQALGRARGELGWNAFQNESEAAGLLQTASIIEQAQGVIGLPTLDLESAHDIDALGSEPQMAHYRNFAINQGSHHVDALRSTFEFHGDCAALQESTRVAYRLLKAEVKTKKGHIGNQHG